MDRGRLGLATFLRGDLDLRGWIALAKELGLGWVELRAEPQMAYAGDLSREDRANLRRELERTGLKFSLHVPIYGVDLVSPNPKIAAASLAEHVAAVDLAADLGVSPVVFHPGSLPRDYASLEGAYECAWRRLELSLEVLVPHAQRRGVRLALENKQRGAGKDLVLSPEEHRRALDRFPELLACLDFGHLHTVDGNFSAYVAALGERLVHVHLHDNHGERDEHLGLGRGSLPWQEAVAALEEAGYRGPIVLEIPDPQELAESVELLCHAHP
jgi:sugar phosphate isomerase/epimerase